MIFSNNTGKDLNLDYSRLQIDADGKTYDWTGADKLTDPAHYQVPAGEFTRVSLSTEAFIGLAHAAEVQVIFGETGTAVFRVPAARRTAFQSMAESFSR